MDRGGDGRGLVELGAEGRGVMRAGRRLGRAWIESLICQGRSRG